MRMKLRNLIIYCLAGFVLSCSGENEPINTGQVDSDPALIDDNLMGLEDQSSLALIPDSNLKPSVLLDYPTIATTDAGVNVEDAAQYVLNRLPNKNWPAIGAITRSDHPLTIAPTTHIDTGSFTIDGKMLKKLYESGEEINWNTISVSGKKLKMSFPDYFNKHLWDRDYRQADLHINEFIKRGPGLNTIKQHFKGCELVEALIESDEELGWQALNMVFKKIDGKYYLVGLINDQHSL